MSPKSPRRLPPRTNPKSQTGSMTVFDKNSHWPNLSKRTITTSLPRATGNLCRTNTWVSGCLMPTTPNTDKLVVVAVLDNSGSTTTSTISPQLWRIMRAWWCRILFSLRSRSKILEEMRSRTAASFWGNKKRKAMSKKTTVFAMRRYRIIRWNGIGSIANNQSNRVSGVRYWVRLITNITRAETVSRSWRTSTK